MVVDGRYDGFGMEVFGVWRFKISKFIQSNLEILVEELTFVSRQKNGKLIPLALPGGSIALILCFANNGAVVS